MTCTPNSRMRNLTQRTLPNKASQLSHRPSSKRNRQDAGSIEMLDVVESVHTKRTRSVPITPDQNCNFHKEAQGSPDSSSACADLTPCSSESEPNDDTSDSEGNSDEDESLAAQNSRQNKNDISHIFQAPALAQKRDLQRARQDLLCSSYTEFVAWKVSALYVAPPSDRLPPRRRLRVIHSEKYEGASGYFHLACPFNASNPEKYRGCLKQYDLQSIEDVIEHLSRHHMKPAYCPMCYNTFDNLFDRDDHISKRTCDLRESGHVDGINGYQKAKMARRDKWYLGETERWRRIWVLLFPNSQPPRTPYLENGCGLIVSMICDFWEIYGQTKVSKYVSSQGLLEECYEDQEKAQLALYNLVLKDLLNRVLEEHQYV